MIKLNFKPLMLFIYWDKGVKSNFGAYIRLGFFCFIRRQYKNDVGLHAHEKQHVRNSWPNPIKHWDKYNSDEQYRLNEEIHCYAIQSLYNPENINVFAYFVSHKYNLNISTVDAEELIRSHFSRM